MTVAALATAVTAIISLLAISKGFKLALADVYGVHGVDIVVSRQGSADRLSSALEQSAVVDVAGLPQVARAAGVLLETLSLEEEEIYGVPTMGLAADSWLLDDYENAVAGDRGASPVAFSSADAAELLIGQNLAGRLNLAPGDTLTLFDEPFLVAGIFRSRSVWENGSLILPLPVLQRLTGRDGQVTYINVVLENRTASGLEQATDSIEAVDARLLAMPTDTFVATDTRLELADAMAWMTSFVAMLMGGFGALNTMMTSVHERTREIGILRALGWPKQRIVLMILLESCGLAFAAAAVGVLAAVALIAALSSAPIVAGMLAPVIDGSVLTAGLGIALGIGLLGAWLPARRAARLLPTAAFRDVA